MKAKMIVLSVAMLVVMLFSGTVSAQVEIYSSDDGSDSGFSSILIGARNRSAFGAFEFSRGIEAQRSIFLARHFAAKPAELGHAMLKNTGSGELLDVQVIQNDVFDIDPVRTLQEYISAQMYVNPETVVLMEMKHVEGSEEGSYYEVSGMVDGMIITARCGDESDPSEPRLASILNGDGFDLYKNAENYLVDILNPDTYEPVYWGYGAGVIRFAFRLQDGSIVDVEVDVNTGVPSMNSELIYAVKDVQGELYQRTGASDVHINGISLALYAGGKGDDFEAHERFTQASETRFVTARIGDYTLTLEHTKLTYYFGTMVYWYLDPNMTYPTVSIVLTSFVDNRTGVDYVSAAQQKVLSLFNTWSGYAEIYAWGIKNGFLDISVSLEPNGSKIFPPYIEYQQDYLKRANFVPITVSIKIDGLNPGSMRIDPAIVDCVTRGRQDAANRLHTALEDVHVTGFTVSYSQDSLANGYSLYVNTERFTLRYSYSMPSIVPAFGDPVSYNTLTLQSFVVIGTGDDLLTVGGAARITLGVRAGLGKSVGDAGYNPVYDLNGSGTISVGDLQMIKNVLSQCGLLYVMKIAGELDQDRDGTLTQDDFDKLFAKVKDALGKKVGDEGWGELYSRYDFNNNGSVTIGDMQCLKNVSDALNIVPPAPVAEEIVNKENAVNPAAEMIANSSDLPQRMDVETQVVNNNGTVTPQLADQNNELSTLQKKL